MGYGLFGGVVVYALYYAPSEIWGLQLLWIGLASIAMLFMMILQTLQVVVFLRFHDVNHGWQWPILFTVRKGILNTVLPAKAGTLVLINTLTRRYPVKWHHYLHFSLIASSASVVTSGLAVAWLLLSNTMFLFLFLVTFLCGYLLSCFFPNFYIGRYPTLLVIALGLYGTMLLSFWCILQGLNLSIGLKDASYFAVAINTLAQLPLTPGNMGVREVVTGLVAPYVRLDPSLGILAGAIFHVIRTTIYGLTLIASDWWAKKYDHESKDIPLDVSSVSKAPKAQVEDDT